MLGALALAGGYGLVLLATELLVQVLPDPDTQALVSQTSTNLDNLARGRLDTLVTSAALTGGSSAGYVLYVVGLVAAGSLVLGARRGIGAFALGHVGATLATAGMLAIDFMPGVDADAVRSAADIGPSYGTIGIVTAAAVMAMPRRWLGAVAGGAIVVGLAASIPGEPGVASWGHLWAAALTLPLGMWFRSSGRSPSAARVLEPSGVT